MAYKTDIPRNDYRMVISEPIELSLHRDYLPGQDGNPTVEQMGNALRTELTDFLDPWYPVPIIITRDKE